ncbi:MAG: substrate-binding domain-containing protein [Xanthobacteraceae bacterium]|nr:substrate-binding domain-containing protein [Xanthobacteraceae bacterium]
MDAPVVVMCTLGLRAVFARAEPEIARAAGRGLDLRFEASNGLMRRIAEGEPADLAIATQAAIAQLAAEGRIAPGTQVDLALSRVGVAVRTGARKPDISTVEAFTRALREAGSVGYTRSGASGLHFARVIARLGLAEAVARKAVVQDGFVGELAARGEVELAVQQLSELAAVDGVDIVGPIPEALQQVTTFSAAVLARAAAPAEAGAIIRYLASAAAAPAMRACGLEPAS